MKKKSISKNIFSFLTTTAMFASILAIFNPSEAAAANDGWKKAGITSQGSLTNSSIFTDLGNVVNFVMAIGGFWVLACLVFAGMRLSAAQGGNPQARTQGFIGILMAGVGIFVIVKATTIAGWFAGFGS